MRGYDANLASVATLIVMSSTAVTNAAVTNAAVRNTALGNTGGMRIVIKTNMPIRSAIFDC